MSDAFGEGLSAALDALAIAVTAARGPGGEDASLATAMQAAYSSAFVEVVTDVASRLRAELAGAGIRVGSPAANATHDACQQSMEVAGVVLYKYLAGSLAVSARLLDRLAAATGRDPDDILSEIAKEVHDA